MVAGLFSWRNDRRRGTGFLIGMVSVIGSSSASSRFRLAGRPFGVRRLHGPYQQQVGAMSQRLDLYEQRARGSPVSLAASRFKLTFRSMKRLHDQLPNGKLLSCIWCWLARHVTKCTLLIGIAAKTSQTFRDGLPGSAVRAA